MHFRVTQNAFRNLTGASFKQPSFWISWGVTLLSIIISLFPAIINGFPILYSDSGTYIERAFSNIPPADRSIGYSWWIRATSWQTGLWPVIIAQAWISVILFKDFIYQYQIPYRHVVLVVLTLILSCCSAYAYTVCHILGDAFAPQGVISIWLWWRFPSVTLGKKIFWLSLWTISIGVHYSHFLTGFVFLIVGIGLLATGSIYSRFKRGLLPIGIWIVVGLLLSWQQYLHNRPFTLNPGAPVFLVARFCENNYVQNYLTKACTEKRWDLCSNQADIPSNPMSFLWDTQHSALYKTYWPKQLANATNDDMFVIAALDCKEILEGMLKDPKTREGMLTEVVNGTSRQLFKNDIALDWGPYGEHSAPLSAITNRVPKDLPAFQASGQQTGGWVHFYWLNTWQWWSIQGLWVLLLLLWRHPQTDLKEMFRFAIWVFLLLFINAFITGGLANVYDRLQTRVFWVIWLLPLPALSSYLKSFFTKFKRVEIPSEKPM